MRILLIFLFVIFAFSKDIYPYQKRVVKGAVLDIAVENSKIYIATDASLVVVLDENNLSVIKEIKVRKIKDFLGELNNADIYSVDVLDGNIIYLAQAEDGYAELFLYDGTKSKKVLDKSKMLYAKAAKFVNKDTVVIALMSDELVLYDIKNQKIIKREKAGDYFYSVMAIDGSRKRVTVGDEGGEVIVVDTSTLKRVKLFKDINKDKILSIDINGNFVAAGSRADKTLAIYDISTLNVKTYKNPDFFVYVVALSLDNSLVVFGDSDKYILKVAKTSALDDIPYRLIGHKNIVNVIKFLDKNTLISGSETGELIKWRLK